MVCKECGADTHWEPFPYQQGVSKKYNADGSLHGDCRKTKPIPVKAEYSPPKEITMPKSEGTDKTILERFSKESETIAKQKIAKYIGVKKACDESGISNPAMIGMIFNAVDKEEL